MTSLTGEKYRVAKSSIDFLVEHQSQFALTLRDPRSQSQNREHIDVAQLD